MKMELFPFSAKKKKRPKDQNMNDLDNLKGGKGGADNAVGSDLLGKGSAGASTANSSFGTPGKKPGSQDAVDIIVDSDEDEIFDDEDDEDGGQGDDKAVGTDVPAQSLDYRDMLAAGTSVMQKVIKTAGREEEESQRTGDSYHSSEGESDDDDDDGDDTESEEEEDEKGNEKGGGGSDSGEDYTDDEDEGEDGYRPGGYHPVKIGEVYNQR